MRWKATARDMLVPASTRGGRMLGAPVLRSPTLDVSVVRARARCDACTHEYGTALGVPCSHCHVVGNWASDEKPKKSVVRAMMRMNGIINGQLLKNIPDLRSPNPSVNCVTCHRGQVVPARSLSGGQ